MEYTKINNKIYLVKIEKKIDKILEIKKLEKKLSELAELKRIKIEEINFDFVEKEKRIKKEMIQLKDIDNNLIIK